MEPNEENKQTKKEVSGGLLKEVASKDEVTVSERLNQVKDFENLFKDVKLNMEEKNMLREIKESAENGEDVKQKMDEMVKAVKERTKDDKSFVAKKKMENVSALLDTHDFWASQPVPKIGDTVGDEAYNAPIDREKSVDEIQSEPL